VFTTPNPERHSGSFAAFRFYHGLGGSTPSFLQACAEGIACNARPACAWFLPLSFIVIGRLFTVAPAASRSGRPDIGVACHPVHRDLHLDPGQSKQAAPGAACCKKKTKEKRSVTSQSPGHLQLVALARSRQASSLPAL